MKKIIFSLLWGIVLHPFILNDSWAETISTADQAVQTAVSQSSINKGAEPSVIAQGALQKATLVEKYVAEYKTKNPNLSEADIYNAALSRAESEMASAVPISTFVSEKVPGATCTCATKGYKGQAECPSEVKISERLYECKVSKGMTSFQGVIREITKWFIYMIMLLGVLALVGAGILGAWGSESEDYTKKAKTWAINIIIGLAILFTFRYILGFLAPWIFQ